MTGLLCVRVALGRLGRADVGWGTGVQGSGLGLGGLGRVVRSPEEGLTMGTTGHVAVCRICDGCGQHK